MLKSAVQMYAGHQLPSTYQHDGAVHLPAFWLRTVEKMGFILFSIDPQYI